MGVALERDASRFVTNGDGWVGRYCFSYGEHYDPANLSFGRMLACNEFLLQPGSGFGPHRHAGVDIVTTVLSGTLTHVLAGARERRGPGSYVLRTGEGVEHDERNEDDDPVRLVQAWVLPGTADPRPARHEQGSTLLAPGTFVLVVAGEVLLEGMPLAAGDSARVRNRATLDGVGQALVWQT